MQPARSNVIPVDFTARRRAALRAFPPPAAAGQTDAMRALGLGRDVVVFRRVPSRPGGAHYLGGRWDWGWTLFAWTEGLDLDPLSHLPTGGRCYVPERVSRAALVSLLIRAPGIGGLLLDGELSAAGNVVRVAPGRLIGREDALAALER